jgi:hypothetical protein
MSELNGETGGIDRVDCGQLVDMAAELALGVLTGRERAAALAHLDGCPACSEYVRELTVTGEELLGLLPPREPPAGFESRVLERLGMPVPSGRTQAGGAPARTGGARVLSVRRGGTRGAGPDRARGAGPDRGRRDRRLGGARTLTAVAIVAGVLAGGLGGWGLHAATTSQSAPRYAAGAVLRSATLLTADHAAAGEIFLHDAAPQWMYADVDMDNAKTTTVLCQLETADGKITTVGQFKLTDGYGFWGGPWTTGADVTAARLVTTDGTVLASATFTS